MIKKFNWKFTTLHRSSTSLDVAKRTTDNEQTTGNELGQITVQDLCSRMEPWTTD